MRSRKTVCYICAMEGMKEKVISGEMSMGQYAVCVVSMECHFVVFVVVDNGF